MSPGSPKYKFSEELSREFRFGGIRIEEKWGGDEVRSKIVKSIKTRFTYICTFSNDESASSKFQKRLVRPEQK